MSLPQKKIVEALVLAINREQPLKTAAYDCGISTSQAYRVVTGLGYRSTLLNLSEMELIRCTRSKNYGASK
jgi:hypothetical protein